MQNSFKSSGLIFLIVMMSLGCASTGMVNHSVGVTDSSFLSYRRGEQAYEIGDYEAAKKNFAEFVAQYPNESLYKVALFYLGRSYEQLKDFDQAREAYTQVMERYKGDFWAQSAEKRLRNLE